MDDRRPHCALSGPVRVPSESRAGLTSGFVPPGLTRDVHGCRQHTVPTVTRDWSLQLVVDARGEQNAGRVAVNGTVGPARHLAVRTGPVLIRCLDGAAVTSTAAAWAMAHATSAHLLPPRPAAPEPATRGAGVAAPAGEVALDGHQRWDVSPPRPGQPFLTLTSDWLVVRVHDLPALETHTRTWAVACALGARVLRTAPMPFNQLLANARDLELARQAALPGLEPGGVSRSR